MIALLLLSLAGVLLSLYAFAIEKRKTSERAFCDINRTMTCSAVLKSKYGHLLGVSNSALGIFFYLLVFFLVVYHSPYVFYFFLLATLGSFYLGYIQIFVLRKFCVVCSMIYVINLFLLLFSLI